eukprot:CAMPEP_0197032324 /NCGR_PEP_ID=MMETSP1384-20130603/11024_1 /TAXON_ID=29189 /ORGANISM="Ammonia sp." /LENGTH=657 /DNA_ID=CAMNT_0042461967 /DNA_START=49 /DNA_END=2022 /DNA_ORIENTATION=-
MEEPAVVSQESFSATLEMDGVNADETEALLYYDPSKGRKNNKTNEEPGAKKPKPSNFSWNERIGFKLNKFWLFRIGLRFGHNRIRTTCVAEILWVCWCAAIFGMAIYLVERSYYYGYSNKLPIVGGFALHSGLLTGIFYAMAIFLSLRYPFYWKWGLFMIGFDRQMIFHKYCAWMGAICCVLHILDNYQTLWNWKAISGWIMYLFALLLLVFASNYFRRKHYNDIFIYSHWIFILGFIIFGWLHNAILVIYGTFIIAIDIVLRLFDNSFRSCKITNIQMLDYDRVMKIEFEKKHFSYRAGQYVFMRFPDLGFFEFHPFSLSSYPGQGKTCTLHIKSSVGGKWTDKLSVYMKLNEGKKEWYKNIRVQIEGPYGELTLGKELYRYEHVVFIGGGIGVTPLDSLYNQLVTDLLDGEVARKAKTKCIDFIFTTRSRSLIGEFASRNKAWQIAAREKELKQERERIMSWANPLATAQLENVHLADIEAYHGAPATEHRRKVQTGNINLQRTRSFYGGSGERQRDSILLTDEDKLIGHDKHTKMKFHRTVSNEYDAKEESDSDEEKENSTMGMAGMNVESLEITNSTHITRVKDKKLRKYYRETYPFINFERPNIRGIIYQAASHTRSKSVCVITSGPKGMIDDCIKWGAEIGVDVHYEVFDW